MIEEADTRLVAALESRAQAVKEFLALREQDPEGYHALPAGPETVERLRGSVHDFPSEGLDLVMREVMGVCASMIEPLDVAVFGPEGGFAHLAGQTHFGGAARFKGHESVKATYAEVDEGRATYGVIPIETSTDGTISASMLCLAGGGARVIGELSLATGLHLYSRTGNAADIEKIYGSAAALIAAERTLKGLFPRATMLDVRSGLIAAELAREDHGAAAIGTELLAEAQPTLREVRRHVEDVGGVQTRYVILARTATKRTGSDRTLLVLALSSEPGSLYAALQPLAERGVNLTRLESRPAGDTPMAAYGARELFFLELDGHASERSVVAALDEVKTKARHVKVIGSYPKPRAPSE